MGMATTQSAYTRRNQDQLGDTSSNNKSPVHTSPSVSPPSASASASNSMAIEEAFTFPTAPPTSSSSNESTPRDRRRSFTYESTSPNGSSEASPSSPTPLSMSFMHKPSRSQSFFTQSNDRTRENSIFNKTLSYSPPKQQLPPQQQQTSDTTVHSSVSSSSSSSSSSPLEKSPTASPSLSPSSAQPPQPPSLDDTNDHFAPPDYFNHKSSLKSVTRSKSLPSTPTFKVHFGNSDIRYFKKKDTPRTISASNSPDFGAQADSSDDDEYEDDDDEDDNDDDDDDHYGTFGTRYNYEYTYADEDDVDDDVKRISSRGSAHRSHNKYNHDLHNFSLGDTKYPKPVASEIKWDLQLLNFAPLSYLKRIEARTPVFLERLFISADKKYLFGHIAVKNLAFEKYLTVRYSVDNWMTIIEIPTTYTEERADVMEKNNYDRFVFKIPLDNLFNTFKMSKNSSTDSLSEDSSSSGNSGDIFRGSSYGDYQKERRYQFCIKYCTQGHEYWDNNKFQNYLVKLVKSRISHQPPPQQQKHHFYNLENKDSKLQDHTRKPRYSHNYLKRVGSDSGINYNSPGTGTDESKNNDDLEDDDTDTITMDANSSGSTLGENIEELLKNTGDAQVKLRGINNNNGGFSPTDSKSTDTNNSGSKKSQNLQLDLDLDSLDTVSTTTPKYKTKFVTNQFNLNSNSNAATKGNLSTGRSNAFNSDLKSKSYKEILDSYCFFKSDSASVSGSVSGNGNGNCNGNGNGNSGSGLGSDISEI